MSKRLRIDWRGQDKLLRKFGQMVTLEDAKTLVAENGKYLTNQMVKEAVFKRFTPMAPKLYSTGATRRSIPMGSGLRDGGLTAYAKPTTEYASYVEYGTRKMTAQPFVKPAFDMAEQKFLSDMRRLVQ